MMLKAMRSTLSMLAVLLATTAAASAQTTERFSTYVLGLPAISSLAGTEKLPVLSSGTPMTATPQQFYAYIFGATSGDVTCTGVGVCTVTKSNGVLFAPSATTDTTNGANISSGIFPAGRMPALTGDCTTVAGAVATTCTKTSGVVFAASATTDTTNAANITSGVLGAGRGGAGGVLGALKGNGSGLVTQAACADISNAAASCSTDATNATNISAGTLNVARLPAVTASNFLGADVALGAIGAYSDGPSMAQGTVGTWIVSGNAMLTTTTAAGDPFFCKLYDGTTIFATGGVNSTNTGRVNVTFTNIIVSAPAANLRIACSDQGTASAGKINYASAGTGPSPSYITGFRIQ